MKEQPKQRNNTWQNSNILLIICSIVVICLILETILRLIGYNPFGHLLNGRELILRPSKNKERIYEANPNSEGYAWKAQVKINSYGFRDKEYSINKDVKTYRIITLGDSVTFGNFLSIEDTFSDQLEVLANEAGKNFVVLNLGLGGYDTLQEVATLEHIGIQFQPDLVVVNYVINDMGSTSPNLQYIQQAQEYGSLIYRLRLAQLVRSNMDVIKLRILNEAANEESNFVKNNEGYIVDVRDDQTLNSIVINLENELVGNDKSISRHVLWSLSYSRIGKLRYSLEKLKSLQDQHEFQVIVVIIPYLLENESNESIYKLVYKIVEYESERLGYEVINVHDLFKSTGFKKVRIDDLHPNRLGHSIIADALYKHINSNLIFMKSSN